MKDVSIEKTSNGYLKFSGYYKGVYYKRMYIDYSKSEARRLFTRYVKDEDSKLMTNN